MSMCLDINSTTLENTLAFSGVTRQLELGAFDRQKLLRICWRVRQIRIWRRLHTRLSRAGNSFVTGPNKFGAREGISKMYPRFYALNSSESDIIGGRADQSLPETNSSEFHSATPILHNNLVPGARVASGSGIKFPETVIQDSLSAEDVTRFY